MTKKPFLRRIYHKISEPLNDFRFMMENRALIRTAMRNEISIKFRERIMLVVTEVNGCRYCSYFHARMALKAGIPSAELDEFLQGTLPLETSPEEEPALYYAQHWAETNANPDAEALQTIINTYGQRKSDAIHIILHMIRMGNLLGNTMDFWLYKLTFGKFGN
jgi:AhpD family alkylhydroperoxidase